MTDSRSRSSAADGVEHACASTSQALDPQVRCFLAACSNRYDQLIEQLHSLVHRGRPEAVLTWVEMTARFAAMNHAGRFADGALENVALRIGCDLPRPEAPPPSPLRLEGSGRRHHQEARRVLHVATVAKAIGGLTRTIINWVRKDPASRHSLLLTRQGSTPVPPSLLKAIADSGGDVIAFPATAPILERAAWLRLLAPRYGDLAILHVIPDDAVPVVAFADETSLPVALVNLADQCFWMGGTIADATINLRDISTSINRHFRSTRNEQLVPIPLSDPSSLTTKAAARERLGISEAECMLLTVGRAIKFAPSHRQSFFKTATRLLEANPLAHLYVIGVTADDHRSSNAFVEHERMRFLGSVTDPSHYQRAADVYLEGFPFGSQTALLESVLPATPCVRAVAPLHPVLAAHDVAIEGISPVPRDESAYLDLATFYLENISARAEVGQRLRERVLHYHVGEHWKVMLNEAYDNLQRLSHDPRPIPTRAGSAQHVDLAISEYHGTRFLGVEPHGAMARVVHNSIYGSAFALRQRGAYADSLHVIRMSSYRPWWFDRRALSFATKLLPHRLLNAGGLIEVEHR